MNRKYMKGFTLVELLAVLAIIAFLIWAFLEWKKGRKKGGIGAPPTSTTPLPYPTLPSGSTPGASANSTFAQGVFTDVHTSHRRLTTQTYVFRRTDWSYLWNPSHRPKEGVVFKVGVKAVNAGDAPAITNVDGNTGSRILSATYAVAVTKSDGTFSIDVHIPHGEFSNQNTLEFIVEEIDDKHSVTRRVIRNDVTITPP